MYLAKEKPVEKQKEEPKEKPLVEQSQMSDNSFNSTYNHPKRILLNNEKPGENKIKYEFLGVHIKF